MRWICLGGFLFAAAPSATAQTSALAEISSVWTSCHAMLARTDWKQDAWTGWKRDVGDGYGDYFQFWDDRDADVSVLREQFFVDGIYTESHTSCFRKTGELAFVLVEALSPNMANPGDELDGPGPLIKREGRIYIAPDGRVLRVSMQIVDETGDKLADVERPESQLARECEAIDLHATVDRVREHEASELGDIKGKRPPYRANDFDWCAAAKP